jgi:hypothetical protein
MEGRRQQGILSYGLLAAGDRTPKLKIRSYLAVHGDNSRKRVI